ncbi:MAG: hypothetical protein EP330_13295 [Deltaproteobacteria bacterium]|nr:MAG: hypothetical protein EP330_13295 [Deltaproteobacteria bacterium]
MNRVLPLLLLTACLGGGDEVRVLGPETVDVESDELGADDVFAVVPVDLLAYDPDNGFALAHEPLHLSVRGAELARVSDLLPDGELWDVVGARPFDLLDARSELEVESDELGAVRVLVVIDGFDTDGGCAEPVELVVDGQSSSGADALLTTSIAPRMPCR